MTTRSDQTAKYRQCGLPGNPYIVPVDSAEQGEWLDPTYLDNDRASARVTLADRNVKTQDSRVMVR
jgi:hypothetical protein